MYIIKDKISLEKKIITYMGRNVDLFEEVKFIRDKNRVAIGIEKWNISDKAQPTEEELNAIDKFCNPYAGLFAKRKRDKLLNETDWTQTNDTPLSEQEIEVYKRYRQELRDISKQENFPNDILWPKL